MDICWFRTSLKCLTHLELCFLSERRISAESVLYYVLYWNWSTLSRSCYVSNNFIKILSIVFLQQYVLLRGICFWSKFIAILCRITEIIAPSSKCYCHVITNCLISFDLIFFSHQLLSMFHLITTAFDGTSWLTNGWVCGSMSSILKFNHLTSIYFGSRYSRLDQIKFFKGCLLQIFHGPFLNTLAHLTFPKMQTCYVLPLNAFFFYQYPSTWCCQKSFPFQLVFIFFERQLHFCHKQEVITAKISTSINSNLL